MCRHCDAAWAGAARAKLCSGSGGAERAHSSRGWGRRRRCVACSKRRGGRRGEGVPGACVRTWLRVKKKKKRKKETWLRVKRPTHLVECEEAGVQGVVQRLAPLQRAAQLRVDCRWAGGQQRCCSSL